ncbi:MAG: hypothetical protein ACI870_000566 [Crocinitomicaceae bacterium]|jgi:hypothetical protein
MIYPGTKITTCLSNDLLSNGNINNSLSSVSRSYYLMSAKFGKYMNMRKTKER